MKKLRTALIQLNSDTNHTQNLRAASEKIQAAAKKGAEFILLPEVFAYRNNTGKDLPCPSETIPGPSTQPLIDLAQKEGVWILAGSVHEQSPEKGKSYNTSVLINPKGEITATYRKMHLFQLNQAADTLNEADRMTAGTNPVMGEVEGIKIGLSICYDLRFPELYRHYANLGAKILVVPSSFTTPTGKAHWEVLLKARAIENQCFVLAPNQVGIGAGGIPTYGHSMVIDPWGAILAEGSPDQEDIIYAELDFEYLEKVRAQLPALQHRVV